MPIFARTLPCYLILQPQPLLMHRRLSLLLVVAGLFTGWSGAMAQCTDLFFSEYIEGSGNNKAVEVYNPTGMAVDLTNYKFLRFNNGSPTPTDSLFPQGTLAPQAVYVIGNASGDSVILAESDTTHSFTFYNGDDALAIINLVTGDTLDIIGVVGQDPGSNWPVGTGATNEFTLVRMASVQQGTTDWALSATQWLVFPQNTNDSLGAHTMTPCGFGCTSDLFFSEYIEGSGNNKAVEVYNPTGMAVDLTNYKFLRFNNGSPTPTDSLFPQGTLAPQAVYVIGNASGDSVILAESDTTHSFTFYNGDDALAIINLVTGDTLDIIGVVGQDPGSNWPVGTGATNEFTLVRMASVQEGTTDWALSATQWLVFPQNTNDSLGAHTMTPCNVVTPPAPALSFAPVAFTVNEFDGSADLTVAIMNAGSDSVAVDVMLAASGTATLGLDFTWTDTTLVFAAGVTTPLTVSVPLIDDTDTEPDETIVFKLMNPTNGATLGNDSVVVTILASDAAIPYYPIGLVSADSDGDGLGDSLGVACELRGVVYGIDMQGSANLISFTIIDPTGGIGVFSTSAPALGYTVLEGDSVHVFGTLNHFNGLFQIAPDTINLISSGNALQAPTVVDSLGEFTESEFIRINGVYLLNPSQWPASGSATVQIVTSNDTLDLRIDSDTDIDGSPAPVGFFDVQGIGGQFDSSFPHNDGYQILPRFLTDIILLPSPGFSFSPVQATVGEGDGMAMFDVTLATAQPDTVMVDVILDVAGSTASLGVDYDGWSDTTLTFAPGFTGPVTLSVDILEDTDVEADETVVFTLANPMGNAVLGDSVFTLTIADNDYPLYPIGLVTADSDGNGEADSVGVRCELRGVIYGVDLRTPGSGGVQVVMRDSTDGVQIFSFSYSFYAPVEGDSVHVQGEIDNFNGLAEIIPDTIILISSGNALAEPVVVTMLDETTENELVMLECVRVLDATQWPAAGANANVDFSNGVDTFTVRIDKETDIDGSTAPTGWLNVIGLGSQFDSSFPFNDGYQLFPRFLTDLVLRPDPSYTFASSGETVDESAGTLTVAIVVSDLNPDVTSFTVAVNQANSTATVGTDFAFADTTIEISGCGGPDTVLLTLDIIDDTDAEGSETISLDIQVGQNGVGGGITTYVVTITETDAIGDLLPAGAVRAFPNPTTGALSLEATHLMERVSLHDLAGRVLSQRAPQGFEAQLDLASLPQGVYLIVVETAAGRWMERIVKQ